MTAKPSPGCAATLSHASFDWRQAGFSLLEVVVAFTILALSLGLLIKVFSQALNTAALSRDYSRAATIAESRLNSVGLDLALETGRYSGMNADGFSWEVLIEPYKSEDFASEPEANVRVFFILSMVSWGSTSDAQHQVSLSTLRIATSSDVDRPALPRELLSPPTSARDEADR